MRRRPVVADRPPHGPPLATVDELRARLREDRPAGSVPLLAEATAMTAGYLTAERDLGRIPGDADVNTLAPTLIGAGHLLFADRTAPAPDADAVRRIVTTVLAGSGGRAQIPSA